MTKTVNCKAYGKWGETSVLFPHRMWERSRNVPKKDGLPAEWPVLIGWLFRSSCTHWLVCEINLGMYNGLTVDRKKNKAGTFAGMLGDPYALASLVSKGVEVDKSCGVCSYTVGEVFDFMNWNKEMLNDVFER